MDDRSVTVAVSPAPNYRLVAFIVGCALFMEQMDATVLATALPTMARDFDVSAPSVSIALTSYLLALAIFVPTSGRLADRFGSRTMFELAIILFLTGSVLCGQATGVAFMVVARLIQGLGGAMMIPIGRLVLLRCVDKRDMMSAMSWLIMPAMVGPLVGPPLGGLIVTYSNWRWIFYLNIPIGVVGFVLVRHFIAEVREATPPVDFPGFLLSAVSLGCLLFGFELASWQGQVRVALVLIGTGLAAGLAYVFYARRRVEPVLDLSLMQVHSFRLSVIAGSLTRISQGAQPLLLPLMFQLGFGMSAASSGTITVAGALGSLMMKGIAPRLLRHFGFRRCLIFNGIAASTGYAICGFFRPGWPVLLIFAILFACGTFMSFQFTALNTIAYAEIPRERMSAATSFYATFQQLMLSLGVCLGSAALQFAMQLTGSSIPRPGDFTTAFLISSAISLLATYWNWKFAVDAGTELSGHSPQGNG
jgi:EmrB/QacA subfamily drug resistance transporter